jgi:Uncharacterized proteins, homologs of microcin C7 resistance protein MccF
MNSLVFPPYLQQGDKVVIVSPSGKMDKFILKEMKKKLEEWKLKPRVSKYAGSSWGKYAGTIKQRTTDFQSALDDKEIKAIFCSRGGYGAVHILDKLDFTRFKEYPKWLIGFSDITALHSLMQYNGYASLHALMGRHLALEADDDPCKTYLKSILFGELPKYTCSGHKLNKTGTVKGILRGGNLAVLYGLRGTPYDFPPEGTILFVEDISERPHAVERMIYNLKLGGVLKRLSGIIIGQFTEFEEDKSLGKELYHALADVLKECECPICFNFPVGHVVNNLPLICGSEIELKVSRKEVALRIVE